MSLSVTMSAANAANDVISVRRDRPSQRGGPAKRTRQSNRYARYAKITYKRALKKAVYSQLRVVDSYIKDGQVVWVLDWIHKFRSMQAGRGTDDQRITPLGWVLRKTKLDELPQVPQALRREINWYGMRPKQVGDLTIISKDYQLKYHYLLGDLGVGIVGFATLFAPYVTGDVATRATWTDAQRTKAQRDTEDMVDLNEYDAKFNTALSRTLVLVATIAPKIFRQELGKVILNLLDQEAKRQGRYETERPNAALERAFPKTNQPKADVQQRKPALTAVRLARSFAVAASALLLASSSNPSQPTRTQKAEATPQETARQNKQRNLTIVRQRLEGVPGVVVVLQEASRPALEARTAAGHNLTK